MLGVSGVNWIQAAAGAVVGLLLGSVISDPLKRLLSLVVHQIANLGTRQIGGRWKTRYWYDTPDGRRVEHEDFIQLTQRGSYVWGTNEGGTDHYYSMDGRLRNDIFYTGTWRSKRDDTTFHGAFQLFAYHDGTRMKGKWLGLDNPDVVNHGEWEWEKVP